MATSEATLLKCFLFCVAFLDKWLDCSYFLMDTNYVNLATQINRKHSLKARRFFLPWRCGTGLFLLVTPLWLSWSWTLQCVQLVGARTRIYHQLERNYLYSNVSQKLSELPLPFFWEPGVSFTLCLQKTSKQLGFGLFNLTNTRKSWYHSLVVGKSSVRSADWHCKQHHILRMRLAC